MALDTIQIRAFEKNSVPLEMAAPVLGIKELDMKRFSNATLLPILNILPGIRMEERSPLSYRLAIRGSSLRSPFGVRNVKVYWENIPLTDANGFTYFNLLDMNSLGGMEVIKGPSGSMYGSGIGGVVLLSSKNNSAGINLSAEGMIGSYGLQNFTLGVGSGSSKANQHLRISTAKADGYRNHSASKRNVINYNAAYFLSPKYSIQVNTLLADINYETPLGLTLDQMQGDRRQARPGAQEQKAGIEQQMLTIGINQEWRLSSRFHQKLAVFGAATNLQNPFITNYEKRKENSIGLRYVSTYTLKKSMIHAGVEIQSSRGTYDVFENEGGQAGDFRESTSANSLNQIYFLQSSTDLGSGFLMDLGLSWNNQKLGWKNQGEWAPKVSLLKKWKQSSTYVLLAKGFSPPTVQEAAFQEAPLLAEEAWNVEIGFKSKVTKKTYLETSIYRQVLSNAIVRGFLPNETQVFVNGGGIEQRALEILLRSTPVKWINYTVSGNFVRASFVDFIDNEVNFSGNSVPSIPATTLAASIDFLIPAGFYLRSNMIYTGSMFLNSGNTEKVEAFFNLDIRAGYALAMGKTLVDAFFGVQNVTNALYGWGNDINPFGGRFYNPSPTRNFQLGLAVKIGN